jgi:hypothetical protein
MAAQMFDIRPLKRALGGNRYLEFKEWNGSKRVDLHWFFFYDSGKQILYDVRHVAQGFPLILLTRTLRHLLVGTRNMPNQKGKTAKGVHMTEHLKILQVTQDIVQMLPTADIVQMPATQDIVQIPQFLS